MTKHYPKLSKILQNLLYMRRINTSELARQIDLPIPTVHRLVTGKSTRPYHSSLKPIADYFDLSIEQLKGEAPLPDPLLEINDRHLIPQLHTREIPVIEWDSLINYAHGNAPKSNELILVDDKLSSADFAVRMPDTSMSPYFPEKSILIFKRNKECSDRNYVLVLLNDSDIVIFRQILFDGAYRYLKPINPDLNMYKMQLSKENDVILGVLVESRHRHQDLD